MELKYVAAIIVALVLVVVFIGLYTGLFKLKPTFDQHIDVRYACSQLNGTIISKSDLETILYGFLTDQCNYFEFELSESLQISEIERIIQKIDSRAKVLPKNECELPVTATSTVFVCCSEVLEAGKPINISKIQVIHSDVLICQRE
jgi:hypothetical protein